MQHCFWQFRNVLDDVGGRNCWASRMHPQEWIFLGLLSVPCCPSCPFPTDLVVTSFNVFVFLCTAIQCLLQRSCNICQVRIPIFWLTGILSHWISMSSHWVAQPWQGNWPARFEGCNSDYRRSWGLNTICSGERKMEITWNNRKW